MSAKRRDAQRAWNRPQLTLRLTPDRRERLERLAARERLLGTPADALDRAIELALAEPSEDSVERLAALEHRIDLAEASGREASEAARAALEQVAQELAKLRALLAALSEEV